MRRRRFSSSFTALALSLFTVACHSAGEPASAKPPQPKFGEAPRSFHPVTLPYADTNSATWRQVVTRLDSFYTAQTRLGFNGAVLVGYKGRILYERYLGWADREAKRPWAANTPSQLASTSKTFTGTAILYLYQRKYLDIDHAVRDYIPSFPYPDLTVRMLLCHRSGLPDYTKWIPQFRKDTRTPIYNDEVLRQFAAHRPALEFRANTRFKYSNSNYAVLASVVEAVTEMKYKDFMKKYIFDPIGLQNTYVFDPADGFTPRTTVSYKASWTREPLMFADGVYGDKGIYSTPQDMYRWDQSFYRQTLVDSNIQEQAYGPCSFERPGVKNYGLGWRMLCYPDGYKVIYHNGWWHGNNTCFYRFVQDNFTIIVLGNKYTGSIYRQPPVVYNIVQGAGSQRAEFGGED